MNRKKAILKLISLMLLNIGFMALTAYLMVFIESFAYAAMGTMSIFKQLLLLLPALVFIALSWANTTRDFAEYIDKKFSIDKIIEAAKKKKPESVAIDRDQLSPREYQEMQIIAKRLLELFSKKSVHMFETQITDDVYGVICESDIGYLSDSLSSIINKGKDE